VLDVEELIKTNEYLSKFKWDIQLPINNTTKIKKRFPRYNIPYSEGIYIFVNSKKEILYVGESGNLFGRLRSKFSELHGSIKKGCEYHRDFWQENQDENMVILTTQVIGKSNRLIVEDYLTMYLQPRFIEYKFYKLYYLY
jgi:hypothetical protein